MSLKCCSKRILCCLNSGWVGPKGSPGRRLEKGGKWGQSIYYLSFLPLGSSEAGSVAQLRSLLFCGSLPQTFFSKPSSHPLRPRGSNSSAVLNIYWSIQCNSLWISIPCVTGWIMSTQKMLKSSLSVSRNMILFGNKIDYLEMVKLIWGH